MYTACYDGSKVHRFGVNNYKILLANEKISEGSMEKMK